ncbi:MAG: hypothetical protein KAT77_03430 [Nanoarchaeota archaeon]|nr:hypothetical protein [Nanoarchaeota archaeon]
MPNTEIKTVIIETIVDVIQNKRQNIREQVKSFGPEDYVVLENNGSHISIIEHHFKNYMYGIIETLDETYIYFRVNNQLYFHSTPKKTENIQ